MMLVWLMISFEIWKRITKHWCTKTYYWCWQATNLSLLSIKRNNVNRYEYRCIFSQQNHGGSHVYTFVFWKYMQQTQLPNFFFYVKLWHLEDTIAVYSIIFCLKEELWYLLRSTRRIRTIWTYSDFSIMEDFIGSQGNCNNGRNYGYQNKKCKIYISDGNTCRKEFDFVTKVCYCSPSLVALNEREL